MTAPTRLVVVTDANVLINLIHVGRLAMCAKLPGHEFAVPDHVHDEIKDAGQRSALDDAVTGGVLRVESITELTTIALYAQLTERLGRGEAACLALAVEHGWIVASDEKKRFRREAEKRIGKGRIIRLTAVGAGG